MTETDFTVRKIHKEMFIWFMLLHISMAIYFCLTAKMISETEGKVIDNWGYIHDIRQDYIRPIKSDLETQAKEIQELKKMIKEKKK